MQLQENVELIEKAQGGKFKDLFLKHPLRCAYAKDLGPLRLPHPKATGLNSTGGLRLGAGLNSTGGLRLGEEFNPVAFGWGNGLLQQFHGWLSTHRRKYKKKIAQAYMIKINSSGL